MFPALAGYRRREGGAEALITADVKWPQRRERNGKSQLPPIYCGTRVPRLAAPISRLQAGVAGWHGKSG